MGKNFPRITTLKENPELFEKTLTLIEKSFQYQAPFTFKEDFSPLIAPENHHNCFIIVNEDEQVLAHVGARESVITLNNKNFPITMLGGIAVDEKYRGEGHFQNLFQDVLAEKRSDTTLFLLWSDLEKLYNKFGFHLCGHQFELPLSNKKSDFVKTKFHLLSLEDQNKIKKLYNDSFKKAYVSLSRTDKDWKELSKVVSADLYIRKNGSTLTDYFFMNKGQDLTDIIYEYGTEHDLGKMLGEISGHGKVWMGSELSTTDQLQYQFFMSPGDLRLFTEFVLAFTDNKISLRNINVMKQEAFFDFNEELMALDVPDFLRGLFGPGTFEELELKPIFISGLDSI
jgi:predicted N-acetyltransferase YhbS